MERVIAALFPQWAMRRELARLALERLYKAAQSSNRRVTPKDARSGDAVMDHAREKLRTWGRHLDENSDLVHSMLDVLAYQAAGGLIEPRVMRRGGAVAERINDDLRAAWLRHRDQLDAGGQMSWCELAELAVRTHVRDGEVFGQHLLNIGVRYPTALPYLLELHEPDMVPYDLMTRQDERPRVIHGIEVDRFGRPRAYHLYRRHPGDYVDTFRFDSETIRVPAEQITHWANRERLGQHRGASVLAPAITRLSDVAEYEEAERMAAKIAASLCAAITRGADFSNPVTSLDADSGQRPLELQPGVVFDGLLPGEKVEVLDTSRPNAELPTFRKAMLRAASAAVGVSYSSATLDFDGTYSSQRQELVDVQARYKCLRDRYVAAFLRPVWRRFVSAVQLADLVSFAGADPMTVADFELVPPAVPWIDPAKEASADATAIDAGIESRHGIIRKRGGDPRRVDDERAADAPAEPEPTAEEAAPDDNVADLAARR